MATPRIDIPGMAALKRDFKQLPKDVQKEFKREMAAVADNVAIFAASKINSRSGDAADGIRSKGASIVERREVPYLRWLDFGSRDPRTGNSRAEGPWRGSGTGPKGGRFLYPALEQSREEIIRATGEAVENAGRKAGFQ